MIKFAVTKRFSSDVAFTAEIDCAESEPTRVKLGLAVKWAFKSGADLGGAYLGGADLRGADLRGAYLGGADLRGADLRGADLRGADLGGADLGGADLRGADLRGADLRGADLRGAYLGDQWVIQGATRSDGYAFFLEKFKDDTEPMVRAGCRRFTFEEAKAHWIKTRGGTSLGRESEIIVVGMMELARARGLIPALVEEKAAA